MHILIANERFLFRFGADRVMMLIAQGLAAAGHKVTMMANRYDEAILRPFSHRILTAPVEGCEYFNLNEFTSTWLEREYDSLFPARERPDLVLVGGWPFFASIPVFRRHAAVVFMDHGVVPVEGYPEGTRRTLEKLKSLRQLHLKSSNLITGVSDFILNTQSIPDSAGTVPVVRVWNGADHLEKSLWSAGKLGTPETSGRALKVLDDLRRAGRKAVLNLGRWEPGCYKNSEAAFEVVRRAKADGQESTVLVLARESELDIPEDLRENFRAVEFPDDHELMELSRRVDAGICLSLWEGFNLPLAELQAIRTPALAFRVGAHPEVISDPWLLCDSPAEMGSKLAALLRGDGLSPERLAAGWERFRREFTWERVVNQYLSIVNVFESALARGERLTEPGLSLFLDVTNSTRDPANSGVIRTTRRLARTLQSLAEPRFVVWDSSKGEYGFPTAAEYDQLGQFNGPDLRPGAPVSPSSEHRISLDDYLRGHEVVNPWLVMTETMIETRFRHIRPYARERNMRMAAVFYDAIPVLRPDLCNEEMKQNHESYMRGLAGTDLIVPISGFSGKCLVDLWREWGVSSSAKVATIDLPAEFGGVARNAALDLPKGPPVRILCVSTVEPRKNHRKLIAACLRLDAEHPELDWSLTMVGNRYAGAAELAQYVEDACRSNPRRLRWLGIVDDKTLENLYRESSFTVYPSEIEGFGLPIVESVWHGRPCVCHNQGAMAELASGGGCLTTDVRDENALYQAILRMVQDGGLRQTLAAVTLTRHVRTWNEYARNFLSAAAGIERGAARLPRLPEKDIGAFPTWIQRIYPDCLTSNWQMNDSERLAITGLLSRIKPQCSIEIGSYHGGSLSLIRQFSQMVFSLDIDPAVSERLAGLEGVSLLVGDSAELLPVLFDELDAAQIPVEFILVDGDHSAAGITRDLNVLMRYRPKKPMFVVLHDSFNPNCRQGMRDADWSSSPYCHWVDLDFVPGRVIEHGGGGHNEMWGGLAAAYFLPVPRAGDLVIGQSALRMYTELASHRYSL